MNNLGENENRENEIRLPSNLRENPFSVPSGYFQSLEQSILFNKKINDLSKDIFSTPQDYQSQLTNDILARVSEEKLREKVSADGFSIPTSNYFSNAKEEILRRTSSEPKVIPIRRKSKAVWMSYAAAACLAIGVGMFALLPQTNSSDSAIANNTVSIDVLPTESIIDYLSFYSETGDLMVLSDHLSENSVNFSDSFSSDEIESYLENSI